MKPPVRECLCQRCESEYFVWFAPNSVWNAVAREDEQFLCLACFVALAKERGVDPSAWMLIPGDMDLFALYKEQAEARERASQWHYENAVLGERQRVSAAAYVNLESNIRPGYMRRQAWLNFEEERGPLTLDTPTPGDG